MQSLLMWPAHKGALVLLLLLDSHKFKSCQWQSSGPLMNSKALCHKCVRKLNQRAFVLF